MHVFLAFLGIVLWLFAWGFGWDYPFSKGLEELQKVRTTNRLGGWLWAESLLLLGILCWVGGIAALTLGFSAGQIAALVFGALFLLAVYPLWRRFGRRWGALAQGTQEALLLFAGLVLAPIIGILILVFGL